MAVVNPILPESIQDDDILSLFKQTNEKAKEKKKKWWNSDPKFFADVEDSVTQWFKNDNLEFESSFGIKKKDKFEYGFDRNYFISILNKISNDPSWNCLHPNWKKINEMNFEKNVRLIHKVDEQDYWIPEWKATMKIQNGSLDGSPIDIRLNLNSELQSQALRYSKVTNYRFKKRKSFQKGIFRIDFTCIKQGPTPQDALKSKTIYQAEIEWDKSQCSSLSQAKENIPSFFEIIDQFLLICQSKDKKSSDHNFATKVHKMERSTSTPSFVPAPPKKKNKKEQQTQVVQKPTPEEEMKEWSMKFEETKPKEDSLSSNDSNINLEATIISQNLPKKRGRKPLDPKAKAAVGKQKGKNKYTSFDYSPLKENFITENTNQSSFLSTNTTTSSVNSNSSNQETSPFILNPFSNSSSPFGNPNPFSSNFVDITPTTTINPFQ